MAVEIQFIRTMFLKNLEVHKVQMALIIIVKLTEKMIYFMTGKLRIFIFTVKKWMATAARHFNSAIYTIFGLCLR